MREQDPQLEAKQKLEAKLSTLPGWTVPKPQAYSSLQSLYASVYETWRDNWDATDQRYYHVVSSETLLLHRWQDYDCIAHLFLYGPAHSGKGQALKIFQQLVPKPLLFSSISTAAIYQATDALHPVLLMDECDRLGFGKDSEYVQSMLQILNVYEHNEAAIRASREGGIIHLYDLFCPKILAGQNPLPGSLPDRCIKLDCEKNVRDIPIDPVIPEGLREQLEYYHGQPLGYNGLTKEQLKQVIGDNRITQLYYPLYATCPDPEGQKALLDLAMEQLNERGQDEGYSELAEVTERVAYKVAEQTGQSVVSVVSVVTGKPPYSLALSDLTIQGYDNMPKDQEINRWLGWRLKKLQFRRERHGNIRYVIVEPGILAKKLRRYAPHLLVTSETSETTDSTHQEYLGRDPA